MDGIITYATDVDINGCVIYNTGWSGITVKCGDEKTLTSGNVRVTDSIITGVTRDTGSNLIAGITIGSVGTIVENNILFNIPNSAVRYSGNNHIIRNNEIYNCVNKTADAGAIYAGRSWKNYGTNIVNNYFHDIGGGIDTSFNASAVFWDDNHSVKASLGLADEVPDENFDMNSIGLKNDYTFVSDISGFDLMYPANNSSISGTQIVLKWNPNPLADSYIYEVASDSNFNNIIKSQLRLRKSTPRRCRYGENRLVFKTLCVACYSYNYICLEKRRYGLGCLLCFTYGY